jgi:hypothetical protein
MRPLSRATCSGKFEFDTVPFRLSESQLAPIGILPSAISRFHPAINASCSLLICLPNADSSLFDAQNLVACGKKVSGTFCEALALLH